MIWFLGRLESSVISHHQESSNPATGSRSLAIDVGKGREGSDGKILSIIIHAMGFVFPLRSGRFGLVALDGLMCRRRLTTTVVAVACCLL